MLRRQPAIDTRTTIPVRLLDGALAAAVTAVMAICAGVAAIAGRRPRSPRRRLLVLDAAYTLRVVRQRGIEHSIRARDLGGFFDHVWSVHPLVGADGDDDPCGPITETALDARHTVIEAHVSADPRLHRTPRLAFALSQCTLLLHLHRLVRREGITAVRAGDPYFLGLLGLALARANRIPLVIRVNGNYDAIYRSVGRLAYPRIFRRRSIEKWIDRFVLSRADLVAGANQDNLDFALANGAPAGRTAVFPYGNLIDPLHFEPPASRSSIDDDVALAGRRYLVCVSRLEPVKLTADVIKVLAAVRRAEPNVAALLVGEGSQRADLEALAVKLGVADGVVFAGDRDQRWIARALSGAAVVLSPMAGRALVEAALGGRPIVAYDVEWHAELLDHDRSGVLVPVRDIEAMAAATVDLLRDPDRSDRIGATGRAVALRRMDPETLDTAERDAYARILFPELLVA